MLAALPARADVVIVGAGFAGASTAYALAERGVEVVLLEQEALAGMHATGRNAALAYSFIAESAVRRLARRGRDFLAAPPADFSLPLENHWVGSLTVAAGEAIPTFEALAATLSAEGIPLERWDEDRIAERLPVVGRWEDAAGWFCADDGVIDIHNLLQNYLRGARARGAQVIYRCRAESLAVGAGAVKGVKTNQGVIQADAVVLAGGPWAGELTATIGLEAPPLSPCRRHLAVVADEDLQPDPAWPFLWHQSEGFYFRPESGGLLICACDLEELPPADVGVNPDEVDALAERALELLPGAPNAHLRRAWAGLRTLTPDDHFLLGPDPRLGGLHWAAGLGGHGMTTSPAVGELVADLLSGAEVAWIDPAPFAPGRFF